MVTIRNRFLDRKNSKLSQHVRKWADPTTREKSWDLSCGFGNPMRCLNKSSIEIALWPFWQKFCKMRLINGWFPNGHLKFLGVIEMKLLAFLPLLNTPVILKIFVRTPGDFSVRMHELLYHVWHCQWIKVVCWVCVCSAKGLDVWSFTV